MAIDEARLEEFIDAFAGDFGAALHASTVVIGDKLGLYRALAELGPTDAATLAASDRAATPASCRSGSTPSTSPATASYSAQTATYWLSPEQAAVLADPTSPAFLVGSHDDRGVHRQGRGEDPRGVQDRRGARLARAPPRPVPRHRAAVQAGLRRQPGVASGSRARRRRRQAHRRRLGRRPRMRPRRLDDPARPGLPELDGHRLRLPPGLDRHRPQARRRGRRRRPRALRGGVRAGLPRDGYDLVCIFDALHDMGDPVGAARHIREALDPDGTWLLVEPMAGDRLEDNVNPVGRIFYSASTFICTPAAQAQPGGYALGAQVPEATLAELSPPTPASAGSAAPPRPRSTGSSRPAQ